MQSKEEITNDKIYHKLTVAIRQYFVGRDIYNMFLHGGCYWFVSALHEYIPNSQIVFNRKIQHCACSFNCGIYDIRGRILNEGFLVATRKDIDYMQKYFIPYFDTKLISNYLSIVMSEQQ